MQCDRARDCIGRTIYQEVKNKRSIERLTDISFMPSGFFDSLQ